MTISDEEFARIKQGMLEDRRTRRFYWIGFRATYWLLAFGYGSLIISAFHLIVGNHWWFYAEVLLSGAFWILSFLIARVWTLFFSWEYFRRHGIDAGGNE